MQNIIVLSVIDFSIKNLLRNLFLQTIICYVTNSTKLKVLTNVSMFALLVINIFKKITLLQAVTNKLMLDPIPDVLSILNRLEKTLISKRIIFKKITIMPPKGQQPKIRGAVCNIPIQVDTVLDNLSRPADSDGVVLVKLKRKLEFKGHAYFESVRLHFVEITLNYL